MAVRKTRDGWETDMRFSFKVNARPASSRERIGQFLRAWADRIDGGISHAVRVATQPEIDPRGIERALSAGFDLASAHIKEQVAEEADEALLRASRPELYEQDAQ